MHRTTLQQWLQVSGYSRLLARFAAASPNCSLSLPYRCPGLIKDPSANQLKLAPSHFGRLAATACSTGLQQLPSVFPKVGLCGGRMGGLGGGGVGLPTKACWTGLHQPALPIPQGA